MIKKENYLKADISKKIALDATKQKNVQDETIELKQVKNNSINQKEQKNKYHFNGKELMDMGKDEIETLLNPIIVKNTLGIVGGSSDTGKSTILRQLALAIVMEDKQFLGFDINATHNKALYISTEDDEDAVGHLLCTKMKHLVKDETKLENLHYFFESDNVLVKIEKFVKDCPVDLVVVDAFGDLYEGDMNMTSKVRPFLEQFRMLARKYQFTALFLHHTGKGTDNNAPSKHNLLGSQGIEGKCRLVIELRKDANNLNERHFCITKQNYLSEDYKNESYVLNFENMVFTNTGRRVPFNSLRKCIAQDEEKQKWVEEAIRLKTEECLTNAQIAKLITDKGLKVGKSTIGNWTKGLSCDNSKDEKIADGNQLKSEPIQE